MTMLCDPNGGFKYTPGGNVQAIWRKYGWTPPTEYRTDYLFDQNREQGGKNEEVTANTSFDRR